MPAEPSDNKPEQLLAVSLTAVLQLQTGATLLIVLATALVQGLRFGFELATLWHDVLSAGFGALLAIAATLLSARSVRRASPDTEAGEQGLPGQVPISLVPIFSGLLNKLVIVGGGIGFGLIYWGLNPILVVLSYLVVQLAGASHLMNKQT